MKKTLFILFIGFLPWIAKAETRIVLTAAITDSFYEFRKSQYLETFAILKQYGYKDFYIIEALNKKGPTFLDDYSSHVFYAQTNNPSFCNNGINEASTLLEGLLHFNFDNNDMIIKLTGRHQFTSDYLLRLVEDNPEYDAFVKVNEDGNVFTLGFAMKHNYIIEMLSLMNFAAMGHVMRPVEYDVGDYIKWKIPQGNFNVYYIPTLHIKANIYASSTCQGASGIQYY